MNDASAGVATIGAAASVALCLACGRAEASEITVFGAASLRDSLTEVAQQFEFRRDGPHIRFNFAGSNTLALQLVAAPRADLFVSANQRWMDYVEQARRIVPGSRRDLLTNTLVVVANAQDDTSLDDVCSLTDPRFEYLLLGDPEAVPAGIYARHYLEHVYCPHTGILWRALASRVLPMPDVRAAVAQVAMRRGTVGIVYRTDARSSAGVRVLRELPRGAGPEIRYSVALIRRQVETVDAERFVDYLGSSEAAVAWRRHGFGLVEGRR